MEGVLQGWCTGRPQERQCPGIRVLESVSSNQCTQYSNRCPRIGVLESVSSNQCPRIGVLESVPWHRRPRG